MPNAPEARQRLADLMEDRRAELELRWQDVADAAKLSLKTLYSARQPDGGAISPLTQRRIEIGLRWEHGSVRRILEGGDPVPLPAAAVPVLRPVPDAPGDAGADAGALLARIAADYPDDRIVQMLARRPGAPAETRLAEVLEWLEVSSGGEKNGTAG